MAPICSPYSKLVLQALDEQCFRCIVEGYVEPPCHPVICVLLESTSGDAQNAPSLVHTAPTERGAPPPQPVTAARAMPWPIPGRPGAPLHRWHYTEQAGALTVGRRRLGVWLDRPD